MSSSQEAESQPIDVGLASIFSYEELQFATKDFNSSQVVGRGGFGVVYRGRLADGREVAVKELDTQHERRIDQFLIEARLLSRLDHKNIVTLYGCTNPQDEKLLLVYEFVPNGSLEDHLCGRRPSKGKLTWEKRIQIAIEIAEALGHLHSLQPPIVHRSIKTANILLENDFSVKVTDFGSCHLLPLNGTHVLTMPQGTQGYIDPEYQQYNKLTTMSDVFSFGVVLAELISGKPALDVCRQNDDIWLVNMFFNKMKNNKMEQLVDFKIPYTEDEETAKMVNLVADIADKCLQTSGYMRPPMIEVLKSLKMIRDGVQWVNVMTSCQEPESQLIDIGLATIFSYEELQSATKFFNPSEVVGRGGFGVVYRGELEDGRKVAVKELSIEYEKRTEDFFNEATLLSRLRHKNLVTLYGCTNPQDEKLLFVYEFVPNGTLADHLHRRRFLKRKLTWEERIQIAIEIAQALVYLHSLRPPIIHRDIKSDNILLENDLSVKVADFGLCRLLPLKRAHVSTMIKGTQGYMDPEYNQYNKLTTMSDVFSFGVVLAELISGKAALDEDREDDEVWLVNMFFNKMKNNKMEQLVDLEVPYAEDKKTAETVNSVTDLAYKCLQTRGHMRPTMIDVLKSLEMIRNGVQLVMTETLMQPQITPPGAAVSPLGEKIRILLRRIRGVYS